MAQENLPSLITLEKICTALGVTLSQFFQEGNSENLTEEQKEVLKIWNDLSTNEQETVMFFLCTVECYSIIKSVFCISIKAIIWKSANQMKVWDAKLQGL